MAPWNGFDDIVVGSSFEGFGRTVSDAEIMMVSALTGGIHQPLHTNIEHIRAHTQFRGVLLPASLIASYAIGLLSATLVYSGITIAALGLDKVRSTIPVHGGDTITPTATVKSKRLTSNPSRGIVEFDVAVRKQDGTVAQTFVYTVMVRA
jgi:acyl dehydratase